MYTTKNVNSIYITVPIFFSFSEVTSKWAYQKVTDKNIKCMLLKFINRLSYII